MTSRLSRNTVLGVALIAALVGIVGYLIGVRAAEHADWRTGTARVFGLPNRAKVSIDVDGWAYGFSTGDEVDWIDKGGTIHSGDWPKCVPLPSGTGAPPRAPIRFATVNVNAAGIGWRDVVMVDCRSTY